MDKNDLEFHVEVIRSLPKNLAIEYLARNFTNESKLKMKNKETQIVKTPIKNAKSYALELLDYLDKHRELIAYDNRIDKDIFYHNHTLALKISFANEFLKENRMRVRDEWMESGITKKFKNRDKNVDYTKIKWNGHCHHCMVLSRDFIMSNGFNFDNTYRTFGEKYGSLEGVTN